MSAKIRLAIVDPHPLFRAGVIHTLTQVGDFEIVAEGAGHDDVFRFAETCTLDVILIDQIDCGIETLRRLRAEHPGLRAMVLTVVADEDQVVAALRAGAAGYMLKGTSGAELVQSIRRVHGGECYVFPSLAARLMGIAVQRQAKPDRFAGLTVREDQILGYLARGRSNKEIGRELQLSEKTIKHYLSGLLQKLEVRNRVEAAILGVDRANMAGRGAPDRAFQPAFSDRNAVRDRSETTIPNGSRTSLVGSRT